ncbi:tetratricopeptide repeat protein [Devosia sediminis]|uniref:Tetratricopeptide repeat protein n=1 Tax=Devosia sediminis TaxID=2798801 RepID=A0A934IYP6_9HYPH|nr:tetratricopeptide repeat protein [Devosia sediminis]MBJ3784655.1 tetratricopeptide repeat protein [Devosia sediminis]
MSKSYQIAKSLRPLLLAGVAAMILSACASNRGHMDMTTTGSIGQSTAGLGELTERYRRNPGDRAVAIHYAAALRAAGQPQQATAAMEQAMSRHPNDVAITVEYARTLTASGRFEQSLQVLQNVIRPDAPDWNALLVMGATLDQMGRHDQARKVYVQASVIAPGEASIETNLGLSYAMTNELPAAENHLRRAAAMRGATTKTRQNLALVIGLQGRFAEAEALYAAELPPDQVAANMAYVQGMLSQKNRWDMIEQG